MERSLTYLIIIPHPLQPPTQRIKPFGDNLALRNCLHSIAPTSPEAAAVYTPLCIHAVVLLTARHNGTLAALAKT